MKKPITPVITAGDHVHALEREVVTNTVASRIALGGLAFDRATFEPGWRWSEQAGAASCPEGHLG